MKYSWKVDLSIQKFDRELDSNIRGLSWLPSVQLLLGLNTSATEVQGV